MPSSLTYECNGYPNLFSIGDSFAKCIVAMNFTNEDNRSAALQILEFWMKDMFLQHIFHWFFLIWCTVCFMRVFLMENISDMEWGEKKMGMKGIRKGKTFCIKMQVHKLLFPWMIYNCALYKSIILQTWIPKIIHEVKSRWIGLSNNNMTSICKIKGNVVQSVRKEGSICLQ